MTDNLFIHKCYEDCEVGKAKSKILLADHNSVADAASDFRYFINDCRKTCTRWRECPQKLGGCKK